MNNLPQPIVFTPVDACEDQNSGYCQLVDVADEPKFRLSKLCDEELLGTGEKLPCEEFTAIEDMSSIFTTLVGMVASDSMIAGTGSGTHTASTVAGYINQGTMYVVSYQIKNHTLGTAKVKVGSNYGETRNANGYYTDIIYSDTGDVLMFEGVDEGENDFDGEFANVVVQCIRYSALFTFTRAGGGDPNDVFSFEGQTKICVTPGTGGDFYRDLPDLTEGKTYKLSFRISGNTSPVPLTGYDVAYALWPSSGSITGLSSANGYYDIYVTAGDGTAGGAPGSAEYLRMSFSDAFNGCIQDITLQEVSEIKVGIFNHDGTENECADYELINDPDYGESGSDSAILALLTNDEACGCIKIGYADSCEDYHGQFSGNNIIEDDTPKTYDGVDPDTGEFVIVGDGETQPVSITYEGVIDPSKCYIGFIKVKSDVAITSMIVTAIIGGVEYPLEGATPSPGVYETFVIDEFLSGSGEDITFVITVEGDIDGTGTVELDTVDVSLCEGQFIPRYWSNCFNIIDKSTCDNTLLIRYSNSKPLFGLSYDDLLPNYSFRFPGKIWHAKFPKTREVNRDSLGKKTINYSDIQKMFTLNTEPLPPYLLEALTVALDHDTVEIGPDSSSMVTYVSETDEIAPSFNKNSNLAPVEVTLSQQDKRMVKSYC